MSQVVLENLYKSFPHRLGKPSAQPEDETGTAVLRRINLTIHDGEFMVLVGPSGCGKSTLLRLIAGLETLTGGNIWVGNQQINTLPPKQRDIAMVFQSYALYPHMTVYDNLAFGLRRTQVKGGEAIEHQPLKSKAHARTALPPWSEALLVSLTRRLPAQWRYWSEQERLVDQRVRTVAQMLQIEALLNRLPKQLSGGQKQRVALGRAMARNPQVFLMDEPLSNLDAKLRTETRTQIVNLQRKLGTTTIYVTHDQVEAMTMGDRIAVMNAGQIQQVATPLEIYHRPANRFVSEFIGSPPMNFLPIQVKTPLLIQHPHFRLTLPETWEASLYPYDGRSLTLGIRPEHLSLSLPAPKNLPVRVTRMEALGSETYLTAEFIDDAEGDADLPTRATSTVPIQAPIQVRIEPDRPVNVGETVWLAIAPDKIHLFDNDTGLAIFA